MVILPLVTNASQPPPDPDVLFPQILLRTAAASPDAIAYVDDDHHTFEAHVARSIGLATGLRHWGVGATTPFAVLAATSATYINLWHAALLGGGVIVPLNDRLADAELIEVLRDCGAGIVVGDDGGARRLERTRTELHGVAVVGADEIAAAGTEQLPPLPDAEAPAVVLYTGGTTGRLRGVVASHRAQVVTLARLRRHAAHVDDTTVAYQTAPLFHLGALFGVLVVPTAGGRTILRHRFDASAALVDVPALAVTHLSMVPAVLGRVLDHPDFMPESFRSVRQLSYGGAPMPSDLQQRVMEVLPWVRLQQTYGMTEAYGVVSVLDHEAHIARRTTPGCVGRPAADVGVAIRDEDGAEVATGRTGEIWVRTASLMTGYHGQPDATADAFRDGWYRTGDGGRLDADGDLHVVDRLKDMIISGGENVYSTEVEHVLVGIAGVLQAAVVGVPHPDWGEEVTAVVVVPEGSDLTAATVIASTRRWLAPYKCPRQVVVTSEPLPVSATGKVLKRLLRERLTR